MTANIEASPAAIQVWVDEVRPALQNPDFQGLKKLLRRSLRPITIAAGGDVVETAVFAPDMQRMRRVSRRIVKGLFYHHTGKPVPASHEVTITFQPDDDLKMKALASNVTLNVVDEHVFIYRWCVLENASIWWLLFYGTTLVVGMTTPCDGEN